MITRFLAAVSALLLIGFAAPAPAEDLGPTLEAAMKAYPKVPAMGLLVIRDGAVSGEAVRGVRRNDGADPVRPGDVWHIGSDGKAMTATMIARLVERGTLRWDAPLEKMLPELAAGMRPEYRSVTLVQLLSHHAGLPHDVVDEKQLVPFFTDTRPLPEQRLAYLALALKDPPVNTPGSAFSYSNTGFLLAAAIAEHAMGKSYETLMREEVFKPLGMTSPGFGIPPAGQPQGHANGKPVTGIADENPLFFAPAGNIYLTLDDWARFCLDQMAGAHDQGKLLKPAGYAKLQTPLADGPYALGWGAIPTIMGRKGPVLTHSGSDGTWYADVALFPNSRSGILVTANAADDLGADKAERDVLKALAPSLAPAAAAAVAPVTEKKP